MAASNSNPMGEPSEEDAPFPTVPGYSNHQRDFRHPSNMDMNLRFEVQMHPDEDSPTRARRLLRESADSAAATLVEIALHGSNESLRLKAAQSILDRVLGPVSSVQAETNDSPLEMLFRELDEVANSE
jgi:hypothetical protein